MKKILLIAALTLVTVTSFAKKEKEFVDGKYSRNSISFVVVNHGDSYDAEVNKAVKSYVNEKFDFNDISLKTVNSSKSRQINPSVKYTGNGYVKVPYASKDIEKMLTGYDLGKSVVSYWFNRTEDGKMDDLKVLERGRMNATDQDVKNAMATKVGREMIAESGYGLIDRSYIVVFDAYALGKYNITTGKSSDQRTGCSVYAVIYAMDLAEGVIDQIFEKGWVYDDDDAATIAKKVKFYDKVRIPVKERLVVTEETFDYTGRGTVSSCIQEAIDNILDNKKMSEWKVASPIIDNHPLQSKIGKKEGVKNGQKFTAYKYVEDKNGNLESKKNGQVRAANKIVDNRGEATGETAPTTFWQISGKPVQTGMMLVENKDWKVNLGIGGQCGGGTGIGADISLGYLAWLNTFAGSRFALYHYALANYVTGVNAITAGYGCGVRLLRNLEFMPYLKVGYKMGDESKFGVDGGIKLNLQIAYPVDLSFGIGGNGFAASKSSGGDSYSDSVMSSMATMPIYFTFGLRFNL